METYILVMFWVYVVDVLAAGYLTSTADYPRTSKVSLGEDLFKTILQVGLGMWTAYLLWGG